MNPDPDDSVADVILGCDDGEPDGRGLSTEVRRTHFALAEHTLHRAHQLGGRPSVSGPIDRSWLSPVIRRGKPAMSAHT